MSFKLEIGGTPVDQDHHEAILQLVESWVGELQSHAPEGLYATMQGTDPNGTPISIDFAAPLHGMPATEAEMREEHQH